MNYRLARFELGPDNLEAAKVIFKDLVPLISEQPGFKSVTTFGDEESGKYGFAVTWESAEASENAKKIVGPRLSQHLADNSASDKPFTTELFEILDNEV